MRIRSIKPEFWRSKDITSLTIDDRLLFIGLWSYVDDNGVGKDDLPSIIGDLFADDMFEDSRETVARVSRGLQTLFDRRLITRYMVSDRQFLHVTNWEQHQRIDRPAKERYPSPDQGFPVDSRHPREDASSPRDIAATGTGEQGNRGTEEQGSSNTVAPAVLASSFDEAWESWPKKTERKQAFERFKTAARKMPADDLSHLIIRFGNAYAATTERQFVPALAVWLRGERWTDELPVARSAERRPTRTEQNLDFVAQLAAEQQAEQRGLTA